MSKLLGDCVRFDRAALLIEFLQFNTSPQDDHGCRNIVLVAQPHLARRFTKPCFYSLELCLDVVASEEYRPDFAIDIANRTARTAQNRGR